MTRILNHPDFLADPAFDQVGISLLYDGTRGIGGAFGNALSDRYTKLIDDLTHLVDFKMTATVIITNLKAGHGVVIGGVNTATGEATFIQLNGSLDDVIDNITIGMGTPYTVSSHSIPAIDTLTDDIVRIEWTYEIESGFATTHIILRDATNAILADISDNQQVDYTVDAFGVFTRADGAPEVAPLTDAVVSSLYVDDVIPASGFEVTSRMVEEELGPIARREASIFHVIARDGTYDRWIEEVTNTTFEFMGFENESDFDAMVNTNAEQLKRRQLMMRQIILNRVCSDILEMVDANRQDPMSLGYDVIIKRKRNKASRMALYLMRLFHPDSMPETLADDKPAASTYPDRPYDPEE